MPEAGRARDRGRKIAVGVAVALQTLAVVFFLGDVIADFRAGGIGPHFIVEAVVALALLVGVAFGARELNRLLELARLREAAVAAAAGALHDLIMLRFGEWQLTPAEADVAMFALKGCDPAEIAELRGAAVGTVRAQLTRVYAKAGVSSRAALLGLFVDDLLGWPPGTERNRAPAAD